MTDTASVGDVPAGEERTASLKAVLSVPANRTEFRFRAEWSDDYERQDSVTVTLNPEAQRESNWADRDTNPFRLSSIDEPERLIGRDDYLRRFADVACLVG